MVMLVRHYTSATPIPIVQTEVTQNEREVLVGRWAQFYEAVAAGRSAAPFKATSRDIEVFFSMIPILLVSQDWRP